MEGAHGVLLSIAGGSDLGLFEINEAASLVQEAAHIDANIIFGTVIDDSLGDEVRVTVIAAGFDAGTPARRPVEATPGRSSIGVGRAGQIGARTSSAGDAAADYREAAPVRAEEASPMGVRGESRQQPVQDDLEDDVDVPSFMRR